MSTSPQVPLLDLKLQYAPLREEIEHAIREVCDAQQFVLGPRVVEFEAAIASYSQARFGIGVSSGTDALLLALMALGVGAGDEVITTPFSFFATAGVIARLGARPVFCDIDLPSFNISPAAVESFLTRQCERESGKLVNRVTGGHVKAIMPVHLFGQMAAMDAICDLARTASLHVIEDAAQSLGAELSDGRRAGSLGDIGCFSFFPTKNLGAFGDAGMCVTSDAAIADKMRVLRVHGGERRYYHSLIGGNFRLDELQAAVLRIKLTHLDDWTAKRQANAANYTQLLNEAGVLDRITVPSVEPGKRHIFNQYVIRLEQRDALREHLLEAGIGCEIYYPLGLHEQQCFGYLGCDSSAYPNATRAARESLALPIFPELTRGQQEYVVESIAAFCGR